MSILKPGENEKPQADTSDKKVKFSSETLKHVSKKEQKASLESKTLQKLKQKEQIQYAFSSCSLRVLDPELDSKLTALMQDEVRERLKAVIGMMTIVLLMSFILLQTDENEQSKANNTALVMIQLFPVIVLVVLYVLSMYASSKFTNWIYLGFHGSHAVCVLIYYLTDVGANLDEAGLLQVGMVSNFYYFICVFLLQIRFVPQIILRACIALFTVMGWKIKQTSLADGFGSDDLIF